MSYELTGLGSLGTVGAAASTGASAGGSAGGSGFNAAATASAAVDAAGSIVSGVVGAVRDVRVMGQQQQAGASASDWSVASWLDETLYGRQAETMAREEARVQQGIQSQMGVQQARGESDIQRQMARLRQSQLQQEIGSRIGGQFGRSRALPSWAWVGIGIGGIGLVLLVVWMVSRRG